MKILTLDGLRSFKDNILNVVNNTIDEKISGIKCDISLEDISESIDDVNIDYVTTSHFNITVQNLQKNTGRIDLEDISESIDDVNIDYVTTEYFNSVIGDINTILNEIIS